VLGARARGGPAAARAVDQVGVPLRAAG
jgi:hypothetical protein